MVLDTSALLHVFFEEPGWEDTVTILLGYESRLLAAPSLVEAQAVVAGRTTAATPEEAMALLDRLLLELGVEVVPFEGDQAELARAAYLRYGRGSGHQAQLNYGDVMAYGLAKARGEALAYLGDDFGHTDLEVVRLG